VKGWPIHTIVRGQAILEKGEIVGKPGYGRFMPAGHA
jgi:dihydropyrimidinase